MSRIERIRGRRIWDGRGRPALEVEVALAGGGLARCRAPEALRRAAGAPVDLRDGGAAFGGLGVSSLVARLEQHVAPALAGLDARDQEGIDRRLLALDPSPALGRLGIDCVLATSLAVAKAAAAACDLPLWRYVGGDERPVLPMPMIELMGAADRDNNDGLALAAVHAVPVGADDIGMALEWTAEVVRETGVQLRRRVAPQPVTPGGGHLATADQAEEVLETAVRAIERAGFTAGEDFALAVEIGAGAFGARGGYVLAREGRRCDAAALMARQLAWLGRYPILALIDPLAPDDGPAWPVLARAAGQGTMIAGADLLLSNPQRIAAAAEAGACNTVALSLAHAGTLTSLRQALSVARASGWNALLAGGVCMTEDLALDLAAGLGIELLLGGGMLGVGYAERWNHAVRLADQLPSGGSLPPRERFRW